MTVDRVNRERILSALREYVDLGLPIIPVCSHDHVGYSERHKASCNQAGKIPLVKGWQTHELTTMQQVQSWIREFKNINIGLPLGHASGYVGIDVDGHLGEDMLEEMSNGDLPETWEYVTGAGRRLLYAIPVGMKTKKYVNTGEGDHQECSILAAGQQTVLPPSIHYTGRVYEWVEDRSPEDLDCALAPDWLLDLVAADRKTPGVMDLTKPNPSYTPGPKAKEVNPILVNDKALPAEFTGFEELELDMQAPDASYTGKKGKEQKDEEAKGLQPEELTQVISAGGRDNQMTRIIGHFCAKFRTLGKDYIMLMAKNHNVQFCDPPLDEMAVEAKVNYFWETEQMKSAQYKDLRGEGDKKTFEAGNIAQAALNQAEEDGFTFKADPDNQIIWVTQKSKGPWQPVDVSGSADNFQKYIKEALTNPEMGGDPKWWSRKNFGEVANAFLYLLREQQRLWITASQNIDTQTMDAFKHIPLEDGKLLDWESGELKPWDPESYLTYTLPIAYDPDAKCPYWDARLAEWLPDEGSRMIMQEFVGYSLIPYMGFEKALMIQGEGANGKSLFLETIQGILGYKVVDSINMRNLFSRFGQADLLGKILNIVNEAGSEYLRGGAADDFKNLVSGGRVKADVKNKAPLTFNNTAKFIFASNHDVKTGDKSQGWLRRMLIVPFDQDFSKSKVPKHQIMSQLREEYAGIFNWCIEGLRRLMANEEFSISETAVKKMRDYSMKNDIAADFFLNCLQGPSPELSVDGEIIEKGVATSTITELFSLWVDYREADLKKRNERIKEYLIKKGFQDKRKSKQYLYMTTAAKTTCWVHLKVNITDADFLETLIQSVELSPNAPIKEYALKRLAELDDETPKKIVVSELPNTQTGTQ